MKNFILLFIAFTGISTFAQQSINDYKYAVLPHKFDFMNAADQYEISSLTKKYLEQIGFTVFYNDEVPREIANENCNKIYVNLNENNSMFTTRLTLLLKDCAGQVLFQSAEGESRDKMSKIAYTQALRQVFSSLNKANYTYSGKELSGNAVQSAKPMELAPVPTQTAVPAETYDAKDMLFAQPIANGFQLIDTTPKVIYRLQLTSRKDVFIAQRDAVNGVLINADGNWIFEAYVGGKLIREAVKVKF